MRKICLTCFFLLSCILPTVAQSGLESLYNKVSVNLFSVLSRTITTDQDYYMAVMHGLMYSRDMMNNNVLRIKFNYFQHATDNTEGDLVDRNVWSDIEMGAGYVRILKQNKVLKPYVSGDLMLTSAIIYQEYGGGTMGTYEKKQLRHTGLSIEPGVGLCFQLSQVLSFAIETNIELGGTYEKGTDYTWTSTTVPYEKPVHRFIFLKRWNPVSMVSFELSF